ncbi:MAG: MFS transporter [Roseibacillus sp.]|nr:MFS transporter [Roseibacillus sp.]MBQ64968.1 MFS transporter [Euryarchaeota archaeon]|tara:strand:+ start:1371 stop:2603 length:1233 start_codon:yes stop_codon:yes gene_type:complete
MERRSYTIVTASYWGFTLTDGALRMLVLLHFHSLGYSSVQLAFLFLLYEACGIVTNLLGGWIGSRFGLKLTLFSGLATQVVALLALSLVQPGWLEVLSVAYVMAAQALSGVAKDLTKMSSKSAVKLLIPALGSREAENRALFKWVAVLTGSKNALKGVGFLLGGVLLGWLGFQWTLWMMAGALFVVLLSGILTMRQDLGRSKAKVKFKQLFSKSREVNYLSFARFFLFGSRDIWFVVGLPVFLKETLNWSFAAVGSFMAAWVIGYGLIQAGAPALLRHGGAGSALRWVGILAAVTGFLALAVELEFHLGIVVLAGLALFGMVFAVNSAIHSYLILAYTDSDDVALNVGFYYMANAGGRLIGTLLSGVIYLFHGLSGCLWVSTGFVVVATALTGLLPRQAKSEALLAAAEK